MGMRSSGAVVSGLIGALSAAGCDSGADSGRSSAPSQQRSGQSKEVPRVEIQVLASGEVQITGVPKSLPEVDKALASLVREGGEVWYYRENAAGDPHPNAVAVIELIVKHQLPISMSTKPDFSDYVDEGGASHPRK